MKKFLLIIFLLFTFTSVNAEELKSNQNEAKVGEKVTVELATDSDKVILDYDRNIFDAINEDSFKLDDDESVSIKDNIFYFSKGENRNITLTLKVKKDALSGNTQITATQDGVTDKINIKIDGKTLKVATSNWLIPVIIAFIILIFMVVYYIKTKDNFKLRNIMILVISGTLIIALVIISVMLAVKKESKPTKNIQEYLIQMEGEDVKVSSVEDGVNANATIDGDYYLQNNNGISEALAYSADIDNYLILTETVKKGENIVITFKANIKPYTEISAAEINGIIYPVKKVGDKYQVIIKAAENFGDYIYTITHVILKNGQKIKISNKSAHNYILKEEPTIENIEINGREKTPVLTFEVKDPEHAFVSGTVVMSSETEKNVLIRTYKISNGDLLNEKVTVGKNRYEIPGLKENMKYNLLIKLEYNLDGKNNDTKYDGDSEEEKEGTFAREYNFSLKNPKLSEKVTANQELKLTFENGLFSYTDVTEITIDGKPYTVTKDENGIYSLSEAILKCPQKGKCKINVESVKIVKDDKTDKVIPVNKKIEYIYMKNEPVIENFTVTYDQTNINGNFKIKDNDESITDGKLVITGPANFKTEISLTADELKSGSVNKAVTLGKSGEYSVLLVANYDLGDGKILNKESTISNITEDIKATIKAVQKPQGKVKRGTTIDLYYTIESNTNDDLTSIKIDGNVIKDDKLVKQEDGTYKVIVTVPTDGEGLTRTLKTTELVYNSTDVVTLNSPTETVVNIFKLVPEIQSFDATYNQTDVTGVFTINDNDNAITNGKLIIEGPDGTKEIMVNASELKGSSLSKPLDLIKAGEYTITLEITYEETGEDGTKQKLSSSNITKDIVASIKKVEPESAFVTRGGTVKLTYTIEDNTEEEVKQITVNGVSLPAIPEGKNKYSVTSSVIEGDELTREFKATAITYDKLVTLSEANTVTYNVYKKAPTIDSFNVSSAGGLISGTFTLNDKENAATGAKYEIDGQIYTLSDEDFKAKRFTNDTVKDANTYEVKLIVIYDLGGGVLKEDVTTTSSVVVAKDATITHSSIKPMFVEKGKDVTINYTVKDNTESELAKITINGIDYNVKSLGSDQYQVIVKVLEGEKAGPLEFKATKLTYQDNETFELTDRANTISATVLKTKPQVSNFTVDYSANQIQGSVTITEQDQEETIQSGKLIITGPCFSEPKEIDVTKDELKSGNFTKSLELTKMGTYNVELVITYNLGNQDETIKTENKTISKALEANILSIKAPQTIAKNGDVRLVYTINDNTDSLVDTITINSEEKKVTYNEEEGTYYVDINAGNVAGNRFFSTTKITYADETGFVDVMQDDAKVYVLKSRPEITGYITYTDATATVTITDIDKAKTSEAKMIFTKVNGEDTKELDISFTDDGIGTVNIASLENGKYNVQVQIGYDLDGDELSNAEFTGIVSKNIENVSIITNYDPIEITELSLNSFNTSKNIVLNLKSINAGNASIAEVEINGKFYPVKLTIENEYTVTVDNPKTKAELKVTKMKFITGVTKDVSNSPVVVVNKNKPTASVEATLMDTNIVKATIDVTDDDSTIDGAKIAVLKNVDTGSEIERKDIEGSDVQFNKALDGGQDGARYQIDVIATYDVVDGDNHENTVIGSSSHIVVNAKVDFKEMTFLTPYAEPGYSYFTIKYVFESNVKLGGDIKGITFHAEEYSGPDYSTVGISSEDKTISRVYCDNSTREHDGANYKTVCRVDYKVPSQSSVLKIKPVSFTYLNEIKTIDTELANNQEKLVDVTKLKPKFSYKTINKYGSQQVEIQLSIDNSEGILQKFDDGSYVHAMLGVNRSKTKVESVTNGENQITLTFDGMKESDLNQGRRLFVEVRYDKYHGNIVNKKDNRVENIPLISYIHYYTKPGEATLNDIELVDSEGNDIGLSFDNNLGIIEINRDDDVYLSFVVDGGVNHPNFNPIKMKAKLDGSDEKVYELTKKDTGKYVTKTPITGLSNSQHNLTITAVSDYIQEIPVTKDNVISIQVVDVHPAEDIPKNDLASIKDKEDDTGAIAVVIHLDLGDEDDIDDDQTIIQNDSENENIDKAHASEDDFQGTEEDYASESTEVLDMNESSNIRNIDLNSNDDSN